MIRVSLSDRVARAARMDLAVSSSPIALEMHLALGRGEPAGQHSAYYTASPEAWEEFCTWARRNRHSHPGANTEALSLARGAYMAHDRVRAALERLAKHPAYRGVAMAGFHPTALPARRCGDGRWWPTRRMAMENSDGSTSEVEFADLLPARITRSGRTFTMWELS